MNNSKPKIDKVTDSVYAELMPKASDFPKPSYLQDAPNSHAPRDAAQLSRAARTKAYDLKSLSAATSQRDRFILVFSELYPLLLELEIEGAQRELHTQFLQLTASTADHLANARTLSHEILGRTLRMFPNGDAFAYDFAGGKIRRT